MQISRITEGMDILQVKGDISSEVWDLCYDSRKCVPGSLFVAIEGLSVDGHDYIEEAVRAGALAVIGERDVQGRDGVVWVRVKDSRRALGIAAKNFYGDPSKELSVIGITGTNGKTTVSYLLESIIRTAGKMAGVIGTINSHFGEVILPAEHTTPESLDLHRIFRRMVNDGADHVIMEVSSHAIDLKRIDECTYAAGVFTNLSPEHLDYHHDMETYYMVKKRLFQQILQGRHKIINGEDPWGARLTREVEGPVLTFGIDISADIRARDYIFSIGGIEANIETPRGVLPISSSLAGRFNLSNILAAVGVSVVLGFSDETIRRGIAEAGSIPGRLERIGTPGEPTVFVDYAHTEDALKNVLETLAQFERSRLVTVFGCGGQRDRLKRPRMGRVATELSDVTIITSDNPRNEDPLAIIEEIESGIDGTQVQKYAFSGGFPEDVSKGYTVLADRRKAIEQAIVSARSTDIILIAGKGHENYQIVDNRRLSFDDRQVVKESLKRRRLEREN